MEIVTEQVYCTFIKPISYIKLISQLLNGLIMLHQQLQNKFINQ